MPLLNKAEIDREVERFRAEVMERMPAPLLASDGSTYNEITARAFACGAEWANMPEARGAEASAVASIVEAVVTGFKIGVAIRERNAVDDAILSASEIV